MEMFHAGESYKTFCRSLSLTTNVVLQFSGMDWCTCMPIYCNVVVHSPF